MSSDEPKTIQAKGEALVTHCPLCGAQFENAALTNRDQRCGICYPDSHRDFLVRVKTGE